MDRELLLSLAEKYDSPLYVYDAQKIEKQYKRMTNAFSSVNHLKINFAVKALSNISILKLFKSFNSGLDTVSVQEVQLGLKAGFEPHDIIYTPNGVSLEEIEQANLAQYLINLALLQQGMLRGEALTGFVKETLGKV